jgi:sugar phosphate isomerase/epimerase
VHPAISINTLCYAPAWLDSHADITARLGSRGISPDLDQVLAFGVSETARLFRDAGLAVATLTHRAFGFASAQETAAARERLGRTIGIAQDIGAQSVIMTTGGRGTLGWDEAADAFAQAIAPCAEQARSAGIAMGIEPTSHLYADVSIAHRLTDTVEIARRAGIAVMVDVFACWVDADLDAALARAAPMTGVAQICDYVHGDRGLPCRAVPGDGAIPLERIVSGLAQGGFRGWYDLEIIGPRLQAEGQEAGLARAGAFIGALLEQAGVTS